LAKKASFRHIGAAKSSKKPIVSLAVGIYLEFVIWDLVFQGRDSLQTFCPIIQIPHYVK
jgi:hypothetical protein